MPKGRTKMLSNRALDTITEGVAVAVPEVPKRFTQDPATLKQLYRRIAQMRLFGHNWVVVGKALAMRSNEAKSLQNINPQMYAITYQEELETYVKQDITADILSFDMKIIRAGHVAMGRFAGAKTKDKDPDAQPTEEDEDPDAQPTGAIVLTPKGQAAQDRFIINRAAKTSADLKSFVKGLLGQDHGDESTERKEALDAGSIKRFTQMLNAETARLLALAKAADAQRSLGSSQHAALRGDVDGDTGSESIRAELEVSSDDVGKVSREGQQEASGDVLGDGKE
ncbi:MAG: hypothetical protein QGD94_07975 [Planctomycetia bacterium]|nr:hypothetical protein [Planctomycetia bacterium]